MLIKVIYIIDKISTVVSENIMTLMQKIFVATLLIINIKFNFYSKCLGTGTGVLPHSYAVLPN